MNLYKWVAISLLNLCIAAFAGMVLRYKIAFALPFIDQKNLLHGHSHFAFIGWVTQLILVLLANQIIEQLPNKWATYRRLLLANLCLGYLIFISFLITGYKGVSILLLVLQIILTYIFASVYIRDLYKIKFNVQSRMWFVAAMIFNLISTLGTLMLGYMKMSGTITEKSYLAAVYFYLHFQYNGWFLFAFIGLAVHWLLTNKIIDSMPPKYFWVFSIAAIPTYFLTILWLDLPKTLFIMVIIAALLQFIAWIGMLRIVVRPLKISLQNHPCIGYHLLTLSCLALSIKLTLQLGSTIPSLSQLAFGYRSIVIGYLHLVLLGVITLGLLSILFLRKIVVVGRWGSLGLIFFVVGIILNELALMIQGLMGMGYLAIPKINVMLFVISMFMAGGTLLMFKKISPPGNYQMD